MLHVVWEKTARKANYAVRNWEKLVTDAKAPQVASGILQLAVNIYGRIAKVAGVKIAEVVDYVTGHSEAWDFDASHAGDLDVGEAAWARDIASLDAAILALLDGETADDQVEDSLNGVLEGSLFSRQLAKEEANVQKLLRTFVAARAQRIWSETEPSHRKGYHAAGIGLAAGKFIDRNLAALIELLGKAESGVAAGDSETTAAAVVAFAELVFQTAPFQAPKELPAKWREALDAWICGHPSSDVIAICDGDGVDLIQEALAYRLPWAMEAVRVHALAVGPDAAEGLTGVAALAVEAGSANISVITLVRAGLSSREAAAAAVGSTGASFSDRAHMRFWLGSDEVKAQSSGHDWPTARSRQAWIQFYEGELKADRRQWKRETESIRVRWADTPPAAGTRVIVEPVASAKAAVLLPDFHPLGELEAAMGGARHDVVSAQVGADRATVEIEYFGPRATR